MCVGLGGGCYLKGVSVDFNCSEYQGLFPVSPVIKGDGGGVLFI